MVPLPFRLEAQTLPATFEQFYRSRLRRVAGHRIRSSLLRSEYDVWAAAANAPSINYNEMQRYMLLLGHRRLKSDGIQYLDVALASEMPGLADTLGTIPLRNPAHVDVLGGALAAIDAALDKLQGLRRVLVGACHCDGADHDCGR